MSHFACKLSSQNDTQRIKNAGRMTDLASACHSLRSRPGKPAGTIKSARSDGSTRAKPRFQSVASRASTNPQRLSSSGRRWVAEPDGTNLISVPSRRGGRLELKVHGFGFLRWSGGPVNLEGSPPFTVTAQAHPSSIPPMRPEKWTMPF